MISGVEVDIDVGEAVTLTTSVYCQGSTGVEMEALTGVFAAALTIYDMCKAVDKGMIIQDVRVIEKLS